MRIFPALAGLAAALTLSGAAMAHHSFAMFDRTKEVELKNAVVARWEWTNPHIWLDVVVPAGKSPAGKYSIEGGSTGLLRRQGWEKSSLKPGDKITVYFAPLKSGEPGGSLLAVMLPGGKMLGARLDQQRSAD
ncbi:DUF6152 family protein [Sphingomonas bacterium]|uniref:DUF6152 family protein n=1 Tax=Sphingomonas bacterium TaxID=1895847 RepID=UPI0015752563|nr:DUF6152 family protein [Sphingomonas bacterium]